jgi:PAS domain S-box-containing protein
MAGCKRRTGIDVVGDVAWGTHFCHFYQTKEDLIDILIPYFQAGLEDNEFCLWVASEPLGVEEAKASLRKVVRNLDDYIEKGQIEILNVSQWYTKSGKFEADKVLQSWIEKEKLAREKGFDGLRVSGNTLWLGSKDWEDFADYEARVDSIIGKYQIISVCSYSLDRCGALEAVEVSKNHQFALVRRDGEWEIFESSRRKQIEEALRESEQNLRNSLDNSPLGIRIITAEGELLYANQAILDIYGYSSIEELKATPAKQRYTPESYTEHRERVRRRRQGKPIPSNYEISIVRKDGEVRHLAVHRREVVWNGETQFQSLYEDITERKKAEEALRESQERYSRLYEGINEAVALFTLPDFRISHWNKRFEDLQKLIIAKDTEDVTITDIAAAVEADDWNRAMEDLDKKLAGESVPELYEIRTKDLEGKRRVLEVKPSFFKEKGQVVGVQVAMTDITKRKQAEKALRQSEERYRALFDSTVVGTFVIDAETMKVVLCNQAAAKAFGFNSVEEALGINPLDFIPPNDKERVLKIIVKDMFEENLRQTNEFRAVTKDGREMCISAVGTKIMHQGRLAGLVSFTDITERKQAEEMLRASEERYRWLADNVKDAIWLMDLGLNLLWLSPSCEKLRGYTVEEMKTMPLDKHVTPESYQRAMGLFLKAKDDEKQGNLDPGRFYGGEFEFFRKDGSTFWGDCKMSFMRNEKGEATAMLFEGFDITERKRAEEALRESEERCSQLYKGISEAVALFRLPEFKISYWNKSFEEYAKQTYGKDVEDISATDVPLSVEADDWNVAMEALAKALAGEPVPDVYEFRIKDLEGKRRVIEVKPAFYKERGQVVGVQVMIADITERKQAEEALKESEERYRSLFENSIEAVFTSNLDGKITSGNKALEELTGYDLEELVGMNWEKTVAPESVASVLKKYNKLLRTGEPIHSMVYETVRKDGARRLTEGYVNLVRKGNRIVGFRGNVRDITERVKAEKALRENEEKLRLMFESVADGIVVTDLNGIIIEANRRAVEINGSRSKNELLGKSTFEFIAPHDREKAAKNMQKTLEQGSTGEIEYTLLKADGSEFPGELSASVLRDASGNPSGFIAVLEDITERKRVEEELQRIERLESIGTLAGGIAHDFNNFLTGILGNITLAKGYVEPKGDAFDRLVEAEKASLWAKNLTQQLLTFARGGVPIKKITSMAELIKDSASFALRGSDVRCEFSLAEDLWPAEIDTGQIGQVIHNVVINADEAMPEGGTVNIRAKNTVLETGTALPLPEGNYVEIRIEDHGVGIPKEYLNRIFDPYFTTKHRGSGLGLATAYSIVKNHGGYIRVESKFGVGTTCYIYLPALEKAIVAKKEVVVEAPVAGKGRILIMDDEEIIRELLSKVLLRAGYEVELASDGAEAIKRYARAKESGRQFDAVILDLTVPGGMGGKEAIKRLRKIDPNVKAIVSSGYATDPIMAHFRKYGFSAIATKPYSAGEMERILHGVIKGEV